MSDSPLLAAKSLSKNFGAVRALAGVDLDLARGELCGLIGPNGSGKSTFFDCLTGLVTPESGSVRLAGEDITGWPLHRRAVDGKMLRSFQRNVVFSRLSVTENLLVAGQQHRLPGIWATFWNGPKTWRILRDLRSRVRELLDLVQLTRLADEPAGNLSVGQQKLLQFAAMLMPSPRLILLDEPLAGVNPLLVETISEAIRIANREMGTTIILIEHNIEVVLGICARVVVLSAGEKIADGPPDAVARMPAVREAYLGY